MINQIGNLSTDVLRFEFSDHVTAKEYEHEIFPAIEKYSKQQPKMKLICHFTDKTSIDMRAMWDDPMVGLKHYFNWKKIAVVSDIPWLKHSFKALGFLMRRHLNTFSNKDLQKQRIGLRKNDLVGTIILE